MRLTSLMTICLVLIGVFAFTSNLSATDLLLGGSATTQQSSNGGNTNPVQEVSTWDRAAAWIWAKQREFHRALTQELRELRGKEGLGWTLVLMSFLYGVFHAAGPGHGKAVLTTYLLTHKNELNRGIAMGTTAALLQGVTALVLIYGLIGLAGWLPRETQTATLWVTRVSFILLASIGLYLLIRSVLSFFRSFRHWRHQASDHHHHHNHDHAQQGHVHGEG